MASPDTLLSLETAMLDTSVLRELSEKTQQLLPLMEAILAPSVTIALLELPSRFLACLEPIKISLNKPFANIVQQERDVPPLE